MNEIVPVGVLAEDAAASLSFYRRVLKIHRVQLVSSDASGEISGSVLRLESPHIAVNTTEVRIRDRQTANFQQISQRLGLVVENLDEMKAKLLDQRIQTFECDGKVSFLDLNGINWDLTDQSKLAA